MRQRESQASHPTEGDAERRHKDHAMPNKPGTPPNTSIVLSKDELDFLNRYHLGKSEAIHAALGAMMSTVESIRSEYGPEVARIAAIAGATSVEELGDGGEGDSHCTFFALHTPQGLIRGATTNAAPVWEDEDAEVFANLAEECGVEL